MAINYATTWLGLLGGGVSGSIVAGGSVYQIDLWNLGGQSLPVRVLITGKRLGIVAEASNCLAMLLVTGCRTAAEMDGITSSGIDWELAIGLKGSALVKTGAKLVTAVAARAAADATNWAVHESSKRLAQWMMDDLGVVQSGKQFNLLPTPLGIGVGAGIFYEWQTLSVMKGKIGWQHISPKWYAEKSGDSVRLQMYDIPEQDGTQVQLGIARDAFGLDPYICWKSTRGDTKVGTKNAFHILGYCYRGCLFERRDGMGYAGINLTNLVPTGEFEDGLFSNSVSKNVARNDTIEVYPVVFRFGNVAYWSSSKQMTVAVDKEGRFVKVTKGGKPGA